jgi:hypothetical protein
MRRALRPGHTGRGGEDVAGSLQRILKSLAT